MTPISLPNLSRFDRLMVAVLLALTAGTIALIWRGEQVGPMLLAIDPAPGAADVSTHTRIRLTFDQPLAAAGPLLRFSPPVSGSEQWAGHSLIFTPAPPLQPATVYTITLAGPLRNARGQALADAPDWQFRTRSPRLLYLAPDEAGQDQLFVIDPAGGGPTPLTRTELGVFDYRLSPAAAAIVFATSRADGGTDLWQIAPTGGEARLLLDCANAMCSGAVWDPTGARLVYERRPLLSATAAPGAPRLWQLDMTTGDTAPVFDDAQRLGYGAGWSSDGAWLSFTDPASQGVQVVHLADGRSVKVPSRMGGLAVWHPHENRFLVADVAGGTEGVAVHLLQAAPEQGGLIDISGEGAGVEDNSPVWSPDGEGVAFTRKVAGASMGRQLWLMRADGRDARYLTNTPDIHYTLPQWSPDGQTLVYQQFPLKTAHPVPSLWLLEVTTGETREVVASGSRAVWLP